MSVQIEDVHDPLQAGLPFQTSLVGSASASTAFPPCWPSTVCFNWSAMAAGVEKSLWALQDLVERTSR